MLSLVAAVLSLSSAYAQEQKAAADGAEKGKYQNVEVAPFTAQEEVKMTPEQLKAVTDTIVRELQDIKKFKQVLREGETPADAAPTLKITGTVVKFKAGSRAKRYFVGFGAGKTKMIANVKYIDRESGKVLYEYTADGDVHMGIFGGDSGGAKSELAEQVAKTAKKRFF
jgi:TolB-like protein